MSDAAVSHAVDAAVRDGLRRWRLLLRGVPSSFMVKVGGGVAAFVFNVLLARTLGASASGTFHLALTACVIAATVARLGFDTAGMRFGAEDALAERWGSLRGTVRRSLRLTGGASLILAFALFAFAPWIADVGFAAPDLAGPLRLFAVGVIPLTQSTVLVGYLRGLKRPVWASVLESLVVPVGAALVIVAVASMRSLEAVIAGYVLALAACWIASRAVWARVVPAAPPGPGLDARTLLSVGVPLFWVTSMNIVMQFADVLMVGALAGQRAAGIYAAALRTATLTNAFLSAVTGVIAPRFAGLWASGARRELERVGRQSTLVMTVCSAPVLIALMVAPAQVMAIFGAEFPEGATALRVLAAGQFVQAATGAVGYLLAMTGHERDLRNVMLASAVIFVAMNWLLIPVWGTVGAATAYTISVVFANAAKTLAVYRRTAMIILPIPSTP